MPSKGTQSEEEITTPYKFDYENLKEVGHFRDLATDKGITLNLS